MKQKRRPRSKGKPVAPLAKMVAQDIRLLQEVLPYRSLHKQNSKIIDDLERTIATDLLDAAKANTLNEVVHALNRTPPASALRKHFRKAYNEWRAAHYGQLPTVKNLEGKLREQAPSCNWTRSTLRYFTRDLGVEVAGVAPSKRLLQLKQADAPVG